MISSVVISRGSQNEQTIESAKMFLVENRPLVVAMFKRQARIGGVSFDDAGVDIEELVELFMLLIAMTDFLNVSLPAFMALNIKAHPSLQYEEQRDTQKSRKIGFT